MGAVDQPSATLRLDVAGVNSTADWRYITSRMLGYTVNSPSRRRVVDRYRPGTATFDLDNGPAPTPDDGLGTAPFTRTNASSPFFGLLKPNRRLQFGFGYMPMVLADNPCLYLRLGESAGATAAGDESANDNDGTYVGSPTLGVAGRITGNTAVTLDGTSQYVTVPDAATLDVGDVFTVEAWIKRGSLGTTQTVLTKVGHFRFWFIAAGTFPADSFRLTTANGGPIVTSTVTVSDTTTWHHVVATKDGPTVKLYLDGVDVTGTVTDSTLTNSTGAFQVGASVSGTSFWDGSIDEVAMYPTALSAARVLAHYEEGLGGFADGWEFTGHANGWPRHYRGRNSDLITVQATDASKRAAGIELDSNWATAVRSRGPSAWWRLGEDSGTVGVDSSGNGNTVVYEGGPTANSRTGLVFDDDDNAIEFDGAMRATIPTGRQVLASFGFTIVAWVHLNDAALHDSTIYAQQADANPGGAYNQLFFGTLAISGEAYVRVGAIVNGSSFADGFYRDSTTALSDDRKHMLAVVFPATGAATTGLKLYIDGVEHVGTFGGFTSTVPAFPTSMIYSAVGNAPDGSPNPAGNVEGTLDEVILFASQLSASDILALHEAGSTPWTDDTPGARAGRILDLIGVGERDRDLDAGRSTMPKAAIQGRKASDALLDCGDAEGIGAVYVDGAGRTVLVGRDAMWTETRRTVSQVTFGDPSSGHCPYYGDVDIIAGDAELATRARASRSGGSDVIRNDDAEQLEVGIVEITKTGLLITDDKIVTDLADWMLDEFSTALDSIPSIELRPGTNALAWRHAVQRRLGDRVTVRPPDGSAAIDATIEGKAWKGRGRRVTCQLTLGRILQPAFVLNDSELDSGDRLVF